MKSFLLDLKKSLAPFVRTIPRILITVSLLFIFSCSAVNYSGFCWSQKRYLSDQEKINFVVDHVLQRYRPQVEIYEMIDDKKLLLSRKDIPNNLILYQSKKDFFGSNKNCCEVKKTLDKSIDLNDGEPGEISFFHRISGTVSDLVHLKYLVRYKDSDGDIVSVLHHTSIAVSSCSSIPNLIND